MKSVTTPPDDVISEPALSLSCTVIIEVELPSPSISDSDAVIEVVTRDTPPKKLTFSVSVISTVLRVADIVADSVALLDVKVAEKVPSPLSVVALIVPLVVLITTVSPPLVRLSPSASFNWTVRTEVETPSAAILKVDAEITDVSGDAEPTITSSLLVASPKI